MIKVELLNRKIAFGTVYGAGELHDAIIQSDGKARLVDNPVVLLKDHEYRVFIPDHLYEELLHG